MRLALGAGLAAALAIASPAGLPEYDEEIWQDLAELAVDDGLGPDLLALTRTASGDAPTPALSATSFAAPPLGLSRSAPAPSATAPR